MAEQLYNNIPIPESLRHNKDFQEFIDNFLPEWNRVVTALKLAKSEIKRLQDEKADA